MHATRHLSLAGLLPCFAGDYEKRMIRLQPNVTIAQGTVLAEANGVGIFTPYAPGMRPKCLLEYDCKTDGAGRAWYYVALGTEHKPFEKVSAYFNGMFRCQDLVGLDQNAVIALGRLIEGDYINGILKMC